MAHRGKKPAVGTSWFWLCPTLLALASCGGTSASGPVGVTDLQTYEAGESGDGQATVSFSIPVTGGVLQSGSQWLMATYSGGLQQSPAAVPQLQAGRRQSLLPSLALPPLSGNSVLLNGRVRTVASTGPARIAYVDDQVRRDVLATDGTTVLWSEQFSRFASQALQGELTASPAVLQAALPLANWSRGGNLAPAGRWIDGSAYLVRTGRRVADTIYAHSCDPVHAPTVFNAPCPGAGQTLEQAFPLALTNAYEEVYEFDHWDDGAVAQVEGVRMWIAHRPQALSASTVASYRVFYELQGAVYTGLLQKAGSTLNVRQPDGTIVDYSLTLNRQAVDSIARALVATGPGGDGTGPADIAGATVDLFGLGASSVNGMLSPSDTRRHYGVPTGWTGAGQTVAVIDPQTRGDIRSDLNAFSRFHGLPECNTANPCFDEVEVPGGSDDYSPAGWALETALDVQTVHAMAPGARIILVKAASARLSDYMAAVQRAVNIPGVAIVTMSYTSPEYVGNDAYDVLFRNHPRIAYFAATGDFGHRAAYPATSAYVTGVGGTAILQLGRTGPDAEVAWPMGSGGTSNRQAMPSWQASFLSSSGPAPASGAKRITPDVSANADPLLSGAAIFQGQAWHAAGGTSQAAPMWAGVAALLGEQLLRNGRSLPQMMVNAAPAGGFNALLYQLQAEALAGGSGMLPLRDVVKGSNARSAAACGECTAMPGFDAVTGLGTPDVARLAAALMARP